MSPDNKMYTGQINLMNYNKDLLQSDVVSNSSLGKKKQVRFTNLYDAQNLKTMKDMRLEMMNKFEQQLEAKKAPPPNMGPHNVFATFRAGI